MLKGPYKENICTNGTVKNFIKVEPKQLASLKIFT